MALTHYLAQTALQARVTDVVLADWRNLDPTNVAGSWLDGTGEQIFVRVATAQMLAASIADGYVDTALAAQSTTVDQAAAVAARGFAGVASDGRSLDSLLFQAVAAARSGFGAGLAPRDAMQAGENTLRTIVQTQVADAGRTAVGAAIASRPNVSGWVRMLQLPSCSRCAVLAGKFYRWNRGFRRHPFCDCRHIPASESVAGDLTVDPKKAIEAGQVTGLSEADTKAILEDGADVGQVINANRGMYTADAFGRKLAATQEGVTVRGVAGKQMKAQGGRYQRTPRLRPEEIYRQATDRADAIRMLRRFGYVTT